MPKADEKPAKPASEMSRQATKKYIAFKAKNRTVYFIYIYA